MNLKNSRLKVSRSSICNASKLSLNFLLIDWEDSGAAGRKELAAAFAEDWDDEVVEEEFAKQLRAEIQKLGK